MAVLPQGDIQIIFSYLVKILINTISEQIESTKFENLHITLIKDSPPYLPSVFFFLGLSQLQRTTPSSKSMLFPVRSTSNV